MKAVKRKLESRAGASILISLMFFLVVMMVGVVCLVAAFNNSGRATHARDDVQRYNAVESAMNLLIEDMKAENAKFVLTRATDSTYKLEVAKTNKDEDGNILYGKLVYDMMLKTTSNTGIYTPGQIQGDTSSKLAITTDTANTYDVNVAGNIQLGDHILKNAADVDDDDLDFTVTVNLWYEKSNEEDKSAEPEKYYKTTIVFPAYVRTVDIYNAASETVTEKIEVSWYEPQITRTE